MVNIKNDSYTTTNSKLKAACKDQKHGTGVIAKRILYTIIK